MKFANLCPICSNKSFEIKYQIKNHQIIQCKICDLVLLGNQVSKEQAIRLYERDYFSGGKSDKGYENYASMENALRRNFSHRVDNIIKDCGPKIDLFEIGAGYGYFLDECSKKGIEAEGIEISKEAQDFAKKNLEVKLYPGAFENFKPKKKYDAVVLWDVIEHIYEPNIILEKIKYMLKPNGLVYLSTGNIDSFAARLTKSGWHLFNLPEHLYFYSEKTITKLLERNGFEIISIKYPNNYFTLGYLLERLAKKMLRLKDMKKIQKITNSSVIQGIYIPVNLFDVMEITASKASKQ